MRETLHKSGLFRVLSWRDLEQFEAAQAFIQRYPDRLSEYWQMAERTYTQANTGVAAGMNLLLAAGVGIGSSVFDLAKGFVGVGSGQVSTSANGAIAAGATTITFTSATGYSAGDEFLATDSTTAGVLGTNPERLFIASFAGAVATLVKPTRFAHLTATKIVRHGSRIDTDLPTGTNCYKGLDTGFPVQGINADSNSVLTWQATFSTADALFAWNAVLIGQTTGTVPLAGTGNNGVTALPASSTILAVGAWVPSPFTKGASLQSLAYELAFDMMGKV